MNVYEDTMQGKECITGGRKSQEKIAELWQNLLPDASCHAGCIGYDKPKSIIERDRNNQKK